MLITNVHASRNGDLSRVSATVDGEFLWFESTDVELTATPEAFTSAFLIPAMSAGEDLRIDVPLCPLWQTNSARAQEVIHGWWQFKKINVQGSKSQQHPDDTTQNDMPLLRQTHTKTGVRAQCFTGGVDSFFTLLHGQEKPDFLVYVYGFDIPLGDDDRLAAYSPALTQIAEAHAARSITISTNLRSIKKFDQISWGISHGGALAGIGHLLRPHVSVLTIPPSYPYHDSRPWGSHWELDRFWSTGSVAIEHGDASLRRHQKLPVLAKNSLAMKHLRVCWENRASSGNCSECEKCVRTMIGLNLINALDDCQAFVGGADTLVEKVDALDPLKTPLISVYEEILRDLKEKKQGEVAGAVARLLDRSGPVTASRSSRFISRLRRLTKSIQ
ncbi:MAG: hypothetical protein AAF662_00320 [Pseudomonadota bacterium]